MYYSKKVGILIVCGEIFVTRLNKYQSKKMHYEFLSVPVQIVCYFEAGRREQCGDIH
jgi:hypothetical protein